MSYILDALRRAEAERQRGAVPGLHAQPTPQRSGDATAPSRNLAAVSAVTIGLLLLAAAAALIGWLWRPATPAAVAAVPAAMPNIAATMPPPVAPPPAAAPPPAPPQIVVVAVPVPAPAPAATPAAAPAAASAPPTAARASAPAGRLPTWAELPESVRGAMPGLTLGGTVHASVASQRLVVLNGQLFHEGDRPLPDLTVQEIRPRSVVLSYRGQAFELGP